MAITIQTFMSSPRFRVILGDTGALESVKRLNHLVNAFDIAGKAAARVQFALFFLARAYLQEPQKSAGIELQTIGQRFDGFRSVWCGLHSEHNHRMTEQSAEVGH